MDRTLPEEFTGRHRDSFIRHALPLVYAHVDPSSSIIRAEAPVDIGWHALVPAVVFTVLATVAVALRWYSRTCITGIIGGEDWFILFALIPSIAMTVVVGGEVHVAAKMAGHRWQDETENVQELAKLVLCSNLLYQVSVGLTKLSFVFQYLQLFQGPSVQKACGAILGAVISTGIFGFFGGLLMCDPVEKFWKPRVPGSCINASKYWLITASMGIIADFAIWFLPMPVLRALRLPRRQKLIVATVFALGGFVCIVSVLRLSLVHLYAVRNEMGRAGISAIVWSTIEANVGIICASLMVMKPLLERMFPQLFEPRRRPSRRNLRLPTIRESATEQASFWSANRGWGPRSEARCTVSRTTSWIEPPTDTAGILLTKKSIVEANLNIENALGKPQRTYSRDSGV